jgi:hypothetical protein
MSSGFPIHVWVLGIGDLVKERYIRTWKEKRTCIKRGIWLINNK